MITSRSKVSYLSHATQKGGRWLKNINSPRIDFSEFSCKNKNCRLLKSEIMTEQLTQHCKNNHNVGTPVYNDRTLSICCLIVFRFGIVTPW